MSTQQNVRLGIVGCGIRATGVGRLFKMHPKCRITALMDRYPLCMENIDTKLELTAVKKYDDFGKMLREAPVDALFLACDPMEQVTLACEAMKAGKHVCTEVPAAFTIEECHELVRIVETTGCKYQLMEQTRYWGFVDVWKRMNETGEFGHICLAQGEYIHYEEQWGFWTDLETGEILPGFTPPEGREVTPTWRYKLMTDPIYYLPHTLSPLLKILDDRVVSVSCMGTNPRSYTYPEKDFPVRDIEYALMHTAKDTILLVGAGFSLPAIGRGPTSHHWYELRGTKANVTSPRSVSDTFQVWRRGMKTFETMDVSVIPCDADVLQAKSGHGGADFKPVDTFINSIVNDTTPPMDVYLSVETAAPAILAAKSARNGGVLLEVPDFRKKGKGV